MTAVVNCVILNRKSLWGYRGDEIVPFIKITCADPKCLPKVKDESMLRLSIAFADFLRAFERGQIDFNGLFPPEIMTYESNIAYTLRFMVDTKASRLSLDVSLPQVVGMNWIEFPGGKYEVYHDTKDKRSLCQIEISAQYVRNLHNKLITVTKILYRMHRMASGPSWLLFAYSVST